MNIIKTQVSLKSPTPSTVESSTFIGWRELASLLPHRPSKLGYLDDDPRDTLGNNAGAWHYQRVMNMISMISGAGSIGWERGGGLGLADTAAL